MRDELFRIGCVPDGDLAAWLLAQNDALGARDDADISLLVSKFFSDGPADTEGEGDAAARALATRIKPEDVVGAAQSFVEERRRNAALKPPAADTGIGAAPGGRAAGREKGREGERASDRERKERERERLSVGRGRGREREDDLYL